MRTSPPHRNLATLPHCTLRSVFHNLDFFSSSLSALGTLDLKVSCSYPRIPESGTSAVLVTKTYLARSHDVIQPNYPSEGINSRRCRFVVAEVIQPAVSKRTGNRDPNASINNSHNIKQEVYHNDNTNNDLDTSKHRKSKSSSFRASRMPSSTVRSAHSSPNHGH